MHKNSSEWDELIVILFFFSFFLHHGVQCSLPPDVVQCSLCPVGKVAMHEISHEWDGLTIIFVRIMCHHCVPLTG